MAILNYIIIDSQGYQLNEIIRKFKMNIMIGIMFYIFPIMSLSSFIYQVVKFKKPANKIVESDLLDSA